MPGYWTPPSGVIEDGETAEEALVREMAEELAVVVRPVREVWQCPAEGVDYWLHWWLVDVVSGEPEPNDDEVAEVRWLTPEEMHDLAPTFAADHEFFDEVWPDR